VVLSVLDRKWREHLYEMDYLQEGIGLRAMAQRDPLVEYQREGYAMFNAMMDAIKEESVGYLFNLKVEVEAVNQDPEAQAQAAATASALGAGAGGVQDAIAPHLRAKGLDAPRRPDHLSYTAPTVDGEGGVLQREVSFAADYGDPNAPVDEAPAVDETPRRRSGKRKKR
jgi:preprotein translocase subunit SecA